MKKGKKFARLEMGVSTPCKLSPCYFNLTFSFPIVLLVWLSFPPVSKVFECVCPNRCPIFPTCNLLMSLSLIYYIVIDKALRWRDFGYTPK